MKPFTFFYFSTYHIIDKVIRMSPNELENIVAEFEIDPKTHPVYFQEYEWNIFNNVLLNRRSLHLHKWVYRLERPMGDVFVVGNDSMTATHLNSGRYCSTCGQVEYLPHEVCEKHTNEHWTQLDLIALGLK